MPHSAKWVAETSQPTAGVKLLAATFHLQSNDPRYNGVKEKTIAEAVTPTPCSFFPGLIRIKSYTMPCRKSWRPIMVSCPSQSHQFRALICSAVCSGGVGKGSNPNTEPSSAGSSQRAIAPTQQRPLRSAPPREATPRPASQLGGVKVRVLANCFNSWNMGMEWNGSMMKTWGDQPMKRGIGMIGIKQEKVATLKNRKAIGVFIPGRDGMLFSGMPQNRSKFVLANWRQETCNGIVSKWDLPNSNGWSWCSICFIASGVIYPNFKPTQMSHLSKASSQ